MRKRLIFVILATGFSGIVAQLLLLRELLITFSGNELSVGIILANWLLSEAIGSFFLGRRVEHINRRLQGLVGLQLLFSLSLPLAVYSTRILREIIGVTPGEGLGLLPIFLASFFILALVSIPHGALFTFSCKLYSLHSNTGDAQGIGKVYIWEILGTIAGAVGFTYLLIPYFHSFQTALGLSLLNLILGVFLLGPFRQKKQILTTKILSGASIIFLLLAGLLIFRGGADKIHQLSIKRQWPSQDVVHYENSRYGNITVVQRGEQYTFYSDGLSIITTPTPDIVFVEEFVHLPLLSHPDPQEILVLSGGAGGVINEILKHPQVKRVDYAELDPLILELVKKFPTPLTKDELSDPRVSIKHIDGRLFIKRTLRKYDLILVGRTNPSDLQVNRLFTKEFFSLVKNRLKEEGILVLGLPSAPRADIQLRELKNLNSCILNTLKGVFPYIKIIPGESINLFLASVSEGVSLINPGTLSQRLAARDIPVNLLVPAYIEYRLQPWWLENFLSSIKDGTEKINQDFKPLGTFYSLSYWNALFSPHLRGVFLQFEKVHLRFFFILLSIITLIFLLIRTRVRALHRASIPLCITTTGFAGMLFDLTLIFTFQALFGFVFHWLGLLVAAFMVGVGVGGAIMTSLLTRIKRDRVSFIKLELAIILFAGTLPVVLLLFHPYLDRPAIFLPLQIVFLVLSFLSGLLVGAQFPLANKIYLDSSPDLSRTAGLLYGADLLGGFAGGVIGGVVLLPVLGLLGTCMVVIMAKVSSLIIVATSA
ncbi:MAG: Polyamine aminopropyltransferase [candidate division WS2 bacterium]|nr:Polyamine aminopropyltransferase [Candidatus Psychracetigena formicireducens]